MAMEMRMRGQGVGSLLLCLAALTLAAPDAEAKKCKGNEFKRAACKAKKAAKKVTKAATNTVETVTKPLGPIGEVATAAVKIQGNIIVETTVLAGNVTNTVDKAVGDTGAELKRAGKNSEEAVSAIKNYVANQATGTVDTLSNAAKRLRQGKVADAFWHLAVDPYKTTESAAYQAAAESSIVNTVGSVAASVYGGPQGAAAYAAWFTYNQTKDINLAIKVGLITGAANAGFKGAAKIPSDELVKKTIVTAAIGGAAVAASGGDNRQILDGFLRSGAMVLIQDGYTKMTDGDLLADAKGSNGIPYCMQALPNSADCAPPEEAYVRNPDGSLAKGPDGKPMIDIKKLDHTRQVVGLASNAKEAEGMLASIKEEIGSDRGLLMKTLSVAAPGLNAGALFHDQWVMVSAMSAVENFATIGPAIVLIYNGTAGPINNQIQQAATDAANSNPKPSAPQQDKEPTRPQRTYMCQKAPVEREISVHTPTEIENLACAVVYERKEALTLPWVAQNSEQYCFKKAEEFVLQHQKWGFQCYVREDAKRTTEVASVK
jgi:hypothetical protein